MYIREMQNRTYAKWSLFYCFEFSEIHSSIFSAVMLYYIIIIFVGIERDEVRQARLDPGSLEVLSFTSSVSANWLSIVLLQAQSWKVNLLVIKLLSIIPHPPYPIPESISITAHIIKKGSRYVSTNMNVILQSKMFILTTSVWFVCALSCLSYLIPLMTYLKIIVWNMFSWSPDSRHIVWRHGFSNMHFPHQHVSNTAIAWIIETKYEDGKFINLYLPRSWPIAP